MKNPMVIGLVSLGTVLALILGVFLSADQITNAHYGMLMLALIVVAIMLGFPTAFTLMGLGMIFGFIAFYTPGQAFYQNSIFDLMVQRTYGVMTNDVLIAVPLFVFMGYIVERSAIVDRLFHSIQLAMRRVPGSLAVATILTCALFATATGIVGAVVTLMGLLAMAPMLRAGYDTKLAAGSITAGGCLGILIPPSILLILYGATAGVSVVRLYAGAFFPGMMLAALYVGYVIARAVINPKVAPALPKDQYAATMFEVFKHLLTSFFPLMLLIVAVLGSIIFLLGWPLEWTEIIVIFMPIFLPLLSHFNIDPLFFGILVAVNLQTAFLSPPVAMAAFYLKGVAPPHVTLNQIFAGMMPFMAIQVLAMVALYVWPQIALWLPSALYD